MSKASLHVISGEAAGAVIPLEPEPFVIGRDCDRGGVAGSIGRDPELSRDRHARVWDDGGRAMIEDLGSSNGTFVNERRIDRPTELREGDTVRVGATTMSVQLDGDTAATTMRGVEAGATRVRSVPGDSGADSGAARDMELTVLAGSYSGTRIPLSGEPIVVGRGVDGPGAFAQDAELSREHARFSAVDGGALIEDLGSTNGTFVNGHRITEPTLARPGDSIWVGMSTLMVEQAGEREQLEPAEPPDPSAESGLLSRFASLSDRHPGRVLAAIGVFFAIAVVFGAPVAGKMHANDPFNDHSSQSVVVNKLIGQATGEHPGAEAIALIAPPGGVKAPGSRELVERVERELRQDPSVTRTLSFYDTSNRSFVSRDERSTYVAAFFKQESDNAANEAAKRLLERVQKPPTVLLGGGAVAGQELGKQVGKDLGKAEGLAFPILFLLSLFVFRGVIAALMPLFVGGITVMTTFLVLRVVNHFLSLSQFALNVVIGLGLGLAIDYSLFVVSRYREELAKVGRDESRTQSYGALPRAADGTGHFAGSEPEALHRAIYTAGRTITYSAITVALAAASLCVIPLPFLVSMGIGGAATALVAVTVSLVALPALLAVLGPRINSLSPARWQRAAERTARAEHEGPWYRLSQTVMKRPIPIATVCIVVLLALGIPFTGIKFIGVDATGVPEGLSARTVNDTLVSDYAGDASSPITALVQAPASARAQVSALAERLRRLPGALPGGEPPQALKNGYWTFAVIPARRALAARTIALVETIRAQPGVGGNRVMTAGNTSQYLDQRSAVSNGLPIVAAIVCVLTVLVLFLMTGSVVLPLKSLVMSFLSLSAAFGILVLIFQDGHLQGLFGFKSLGAIDISQPILIFAIAFGLASDYTVFLLTRIREAHDAGHSNRDAVAYGLERTGRIVTQAALLLCIAIGAFATSSVVFIKEVGIGIAVAVILDATVIRALLVPSLMALLGDRNWWAPGPLRRLHNRIGLSEGP